MIIKLVKRIYAKLTFIFIVIYAFNSVSAKDIPKPKTPQVDSIYVSKSKCKMYLFDHSKMIKSYAISIGGSPIGHKKKKGDNKTPEGLYFINGKNPNSNYYMNLGISYPNHTDRMNAQRTKLNPGGDIKIHGYADKYGSTKDKSIRYSSTWGCIAVTNSDMLEIYNLVKVGAKIFIVP
jgi:murein L,D-transpeptidase YafK